MQVKSRAKEACETLSMNAAAAPMQTEKPGLNAKSGNDLSARRLQREWKTMSAMVRIYCRGRHHPAERLCDECRQFLGYAEVRLERCRFGQEKPTCAKCPVHCYQRNRREQARAIMRYAGPRMLWEHPILSLFHWLDGFRKAPTV